ncbi:MAG: hypothetical protein ACREV5_20050, partial [Steroidobacter sp.]
MAPKVGGSIVAFLLQRTAVAGGFGFLGLIAIFTIAELNVAIGERSIWFPVPALCVAGAMLALVERGRESRSPRWYASGVWLQVCLLAALVAILGIVLSGVERVLDGNIALRGDSKSASVEFRTVYSLVIGIAAAMVEEASVRGLFQLRAREVVGEVYAQIGAGMTFLALHGPDILEPRRLLFLVVVSVCGGVSEILCASRLMKSLVHNESVFKL